MKKIKYYEALRCKDGKFDKFEQHEGFLETLYDSETDTQMNVVFRKHDSLKWQCTHLESGILIVSGFETRKRCVEQMLLLTNKVAKILNDKSNKFLFELIAKLEEYRNGVELNYAID